jgi:hypothetical protein
MKEILAVAAGVTVVVMLVATGALAAIDLTRTFSPVTMTVSTISFDATASAKSYCRGKGYGLAGYQFGTLQGNPWNDVGRAYYVSISCVRGPLS